MDALTILLNAKLNTSQSTSNISKEKKKLESEVNKTPIQLTIEANTGIATQEMSKAAKAYDKMWQKAFYNQEQNAIKAANAIKSAYDSKLSGLRQEGQKYTKSASSQLEKMYSKYSYADKGDLEKLRNLQLELSRGGNFKTLESIPSKIAEYQEKIVQLEKDLHVTHNKNLSAINKEIELENKKAQQELAHEKQRQQNKQSYDTQFFKEFNKSLGIGVEQSSQKITKQNSALAELFEKSSKSTVGLSSLEKQTVKLNPAMKELGAVTKKSAQSFSSVIQKIGLWGIATGAVYGTIRAIKEGVDYVMQLDNAMNEVRIVTGKTQVEVEALAESYNKLGKEMRVLTSDIAATSADLYRQGLTDAEVTDRMKAIIKYAKISGISLEDSNKIITATANATGESVNKITDVFAYLGRQNCPLVA